MIFQSNYDIVCQEMIFYVQVLPLHDTGPAQEFWLRDPEPLNLLNCKPAPVDTRLQV